MSKNLPENNKSNEVQELIQIENKRLDIQKDELSIRAKVLENEPKLWEEQSKDLRGRRGLIKFIITTGCTCLLAILALFLFGGGKEILDKHLGNIMTFIITIISFIGGRLSNSRPSRQ